MPDPNSKRRREMPAAEHAAADEPAGEPLDDTLSRALTDEERARLSMDSWEPSLLRYLLSAQGRLDRGSKG